MNKILLAFLVVSCILAGALEIYSGFSQTPSRFLALPFIFATLTSGVALHLSAKAKLAKAWFEGYTRSIEDTKDAITNVRSASIDDIAYNNNPYTKRRKNGTRA